MRLANKLTLALSLGASLVLTGKAAFDVRREKAFFENEALREEAQMGQVLAAAIGEVWRSEGQARALELVNSAHGAKETLQVRFVWLDDQAPPEFRARLPVSAVAPNISAGQPMSVRAPELDEEGVIISYAPIDHRGARLGAIEISKSLAEENRYVEASLIRTLEVTALLIGLFVAMSAVFGALVVARPVQALVAHLRRIGSGDFTGNVETESRDELMLLGSEINAMTNHMRHANRLTTVGTVAAGIAHELGTPLHVVGSSAQAILRDSLDARELKENATVIWEQSARMATIIRNLLDFARRRELQLESYDVRHIVEQAVSLVQPLAAKHRVKMVLHAPDSPVLANVDLTQLQQALTNLLINALHASKPDHDIEISTGLKMVERPADLGGGLAELVSIAVKDYGQGMTEETLRKLFEPFFTTKPVGEGTGLGLPIAFAIVREHDGFIDAVTSLGVGSTVSIYLPKPKEA